MASFIRPMAAWRHLGIHDDVALASPRCGDRPETWHRRYTRQDRLRRDLGTRRRSPSRAGGAGITQTRQPDVPDLLTKADQLYSQGDQEGAAGSGPRRMRSRESRAAPTAAVAVAARSSGRPPERRRLGPGAGYGRGGGGQASGAGSGSGAWGDTASIDASQAASSSAAWGDRAQSMQGLTQRPQQVMQGVQGIVQSAMGGRCRRRAGTATEPGQGRSAPCIARQGGTERGKGEGGPLARHAEPAADASAVRPPHDKAELGAQAPGRPAPRPRLRAPPRLRCRHRPDLSSQNAAADGLMPVSECVRRRTPIASRNRSSWLTTTNAPR